VTAAGISERRVLVTGSSGFIGTNVVDALYKRGTTVLGIDIHPPKNSAHASLWKRIDLLDTMGLARAVDEFAPHAVLHLGARTDLNGLGVADYKSNHEGTRNLLDAAQSCSSVDKVIFASSRLVNRIGYEPASATDYCPSTPYGESKVLGEEVVRAAQKLRYEWCIVRPTSIWGPWFGVPYRNFFDAVLAGRYIHPKGHRVLKSFGYVGNAVYELLSLMDAPPGEIEGQTHYLTDYSPIEVYEFAKEVARQAGCGPVTEIPYAALKAGALAGDLLKRLGMNNPPLTSFRLDNLVTPMLYDTTNLRRLVGPLPHTHEEGIAQTLLWLSTAS
jgi:GlcNAc-P-P-Und epimerase